MSESVERRRPERRVRDARFALMMLVALLATYGAWQARDTASRVVRDERQTCAIQRRGLPAGHELAASMADIHALLLVPRPRGSRPPSQRVQRIVADLNAHLAAYQAAERKQPRRRACQI